MSTSTTLITFLLQAPPNVFSVELLGSWDNFSKPYKLSRDRKTGDDHWRGCHVFENITCDGDTSERSAGRDGGLMMGGTYWYYYRLNSETEYHDPVEPFTSSCPLLPGQPANVLDVPVQPKMPKSISGSDSSDSLDLDALVFTLDPRDKYLPPGVRRARTTSAIQQRKAGLHRAPKMPLTTLEQNSQDVEDPPQTATSTKAGPTLKPQRSLISIFDKMRRTKSAGSSTRATTSWHRKLLSRAGSRAGSSKKAYPTEDAPAVPKIPDNIFAKSQSNSASTTPPSLERPATGAVTDPVVSLTTAAKGLSLSFEAARPMQKHALEPTPKQGALFPNDIPNTSLLGKFGAPSKPRNVAPYVPESEHFEDYHSKADDFNSSPDADPPFMPVISNSAFRIATDSFAAHDKMEDETFICPADRHEALETAAYVSAYGYAESCLSSYATEDNFSPCFASKSNLSGPMSPMQLSQPETPVMSDFEDDAASWTGGSDSLNFSATSMAPPSRTPPPPPSQQPSFSNPFRILPPLGGFQGYSLPQDEQGSAHTIKKLPSTHFGHSDHPLHHQSSNKDLVNSWNDGSEHRMTALEELVDDLGYLGELIN